MGTLTANDARLPTYCEHKLPTSCRLSSIPNCCACADERAHAPSYSTYIDGIGFVPRGNRWQRYCWYCKEFWQKRVEVSGLRPAQTRIPTEPDQAEFLERWYEFHKGYRIVKYEDGREDRVAVVGEDFRDVSPGCLPRTLAEMREGRAAEIVLPQTQRGTEQTQEDNGPSLEEALESMYSDAVNEEQTQQVAAPRSPVLAVQRLPEQVIEPTNIHAQVMNPTAAREREQQVRRVAALRRQLLRLRSGIERVISGLRDLGEDVSDDNGSGDVIDRLNAIVDTSRPRAAVSEATPEAATAHIQNLERRIEDTRQLLTTARQGRDRAADDLRTAQSEMQELTNRMQHLQREQRTMENYVRVFGSREEVIAQGESYESPIGGMFTRAMERFRVAEDVRREERTLRQVLEDEARIDGNEAVSRRLEELESRERDVWGVPQADRSAEIPTTTVAADNAAADTYVGFGHEVEPSNDEDDENETPPVLANTDDEVALQEYYAMVRRQDWSEDAHSPLRSRRRSDDNNFPRNMLNAIVAARAREVAETNENSNTPNNHDDADEQDINEAPPPRFSEDEWWHDDARIIVRALAESETLREEVNMTAQGASHLLAYLIDSYITESDRMTIDGLLRNKTVIWHAGLPTEWLRRRTELAHASSAQAPLFFTGSGGNGGSEAWAGHHNPYIRVEVVAQAFMMSRAVRQTCPGLSAPAQLQMLYRLQAGGRSQQDVEKLEQMTNDRATFSFALAVYRRSVNGDNDEDEATERVNSHLMERARYGDHSRQALDTRRQGMQDMSTRAWALAAGRQAMQTGSQALIEQAANASANLVASEDRESGTRAAYHRLRTSGFISGAGRTTLYRRLSPSDDPTTSAGSSRSSSPEPLRGLDARDSGRPEPKSDEELTVPMECKICYTQMAEIACLPCGHLVMCRWCSEQHSPCFSQDRTRPRRPTGCPVCRKTIRQKVRVFRV